MRRALSPREGINADDEYSPMALPANQRHPFGLAVADHPDAAEPHHPRRAPRREAFMSWNPEQVVLMALFVAALMVGYFASTWMWQIEFTEPLSGLPGQGTRQKMLDEMDARAATAGGYAMQHGVAGPVTREAYLQYFRPMEIGEASVARHGGSRKADLQQVEELADMYRKQRGGAMETPGATREDDLWEELQYRGSDPSQQLLAERDRQLLAELEALIAEEQAYTPLDPLADVLQTLRSRFGFRSEVPGTLSLHERRRMCPALEQTLGQPMDPRRKVLFIIGTQKGGTTFLFNALKKHPAFVGADHAYAQKRGPWAKEVHFFNRWPLPNPPKREFLRCFPSSTWNVDAFGDAHNFTLVDATPDYMFNAMAAPRIKAMWPDAQFLVLLRDPIARAFSAWTMSKRMACRQQARKNPQAVCSFPTFAQMVVDEANMLRRRGCTFSRAGLLFPKSWAECYGCRATFVDKSKCSSWTFHDEPCHAPPFLTLSVSTYAAQLSWWLAHFPLSQFKFVTSADLHVRDPTPILNSIIDFAGLETKPFVPEMMRDVWGYDGGYNITNLSPLERKAVEYLQLYFRQSELDLHALLAPLGFEGIPQEIH